jgi:DNA polymerase
MKLLTLDFETAYGKHPETGEDITLSKMTTEEYVRHPKFKIHGVGLKWNDNPGVYWHTPFELDKLHKLPWHDIAVLCHNTMFDGFILHEHFKLYPKMYLDTLSMGRALYPQESVSLSNLSKLLGVGKKGHELENTKDKWELTDAEQRRLGGYCATNQDSDCNLTWRLFQIMKTMMPLEELRVIDLTLRMFCDPILELDKDVLEDHLSEVLARKSTLLASVDVDLKELRSNQKFADTLLSLGVDPPLKISKTTKKETYAFAKTDEGMLALLDHEDPIVATLAEARLGVKSSIEETRTVRYLGIAERGPLPVALSYCGAGNTLRWSAADKQNLQNLPRKGNLRRAIVAPPGYILVVADLSAIEARMLAWMAGQESLLRIFREGGDVYCAFAADIFQRAITKKNELERFLGKVCILGLGYSMSWPTLARAMAIGPLGQAPVIFGVDHLNMFGYTPEDVAEWRNNKDFWKKAKKTTNKLKGDDLAAHCLIASYLVNTYRAANDAIPDYWKSCTSMLRSMSRGTSQDFGAVYTEQDRLWLPSGLSLQYRNLRREEDEDSDDGKMNWVYDGRKGKQFIYGAKLTENITQALSRIVLSHWMVNIKAHNPQYKVAWTVHDEVICCVPEDMGEQCLDDCIELVKDAPAWCPDLPLAAEGGLAYNYGEAK